MLFFRNFLVHWRALSAPRFAALLGTFSQSVRGFEGDRLSLQRLWGVAPAFWGSQPRITAKSGWITLLASRDPGKRAAMQIAACALGIQMTACFGDGLSPDLTFPAPSSLPAFLRVLGPWVVVVLCLGSFSLSLWGWFRSPFPLVFGFLPCVLRRVAPSCVDHAAPCCPVTYL